MERIKSIVPVDENARQKAQDRWNAIAKPLHSLGLLEDAVIDLAGIFGTEEVNIDKKCAVVMCADNGVLSEGVAQSDHNVTSIVAKSMAEGTSNINLMAQTAGCDVFPVDLGMINDVDHPNMINKKISKGTNNISEGPAMSYEQATQAIVTGIDMVKELSEKGYKIIVTGEMGIGNTTTSSAMATILLTARPEEVTGRGAGLSDDGLQRKIAAIRKAISYNEIDSFDPIDIVAKVGGYDIAGLAGVFLGGAIYRIPVVIDGFISSVAALLAICFETSCAGYMLASHMSNEPASVRVMEYIEKQPIIRGELCLGEGTGAVLLLPLLDAALKVYHSVHKFDAINIEQYQEYDS